MKSHVSCQPAGYHCLMETCSGERCFRLEDVLGSDYTQQRLDMANNEFATLVSLPANPGVPPRGAMLYLHGFVDYFFQDHVARHFAEQDWAWYAVDLRRYGRSLRPNQEPWYTDDLTEYYEELDLSIDRIRADGHERIVLMGHSTGGLIGSIWAHDRRKSHPIDGLILNSPWLDLQGSTFDRTVGTWLLRGVAKVRPLMNVPRKLSDIYPQSIHSCARGEWNFNPQWKPLTRQPVKAGFFAAVRKQHARLHRGLDVGVSVLMLRSDRSRLDLDSWHDDAHVTDIVLDVEHMERWLPKVGRDVTDIPLPGAKHDVMLSASPVRERAMAEIDTWLAEKLS